MIPGFFIGGIEITHVLSSNLKVHINVLADIFGMCRLGERQRSFLKYVPD